MMEVKLDRIFDTQREESGLSTSQVAIIASKTFTKVFICPGNQEIKPFFYELKHHLIFEVGKKSIYDEHMNDVVEKR